MNSKLKLALNKIIFTKFKVTSKSPFMIAGPTGFKLILVMYA